MHEEIMQRLKEFADMVNNQIHKHGTYGGYDNVQDAIDGMSNWELLELLTDNECQELI